MRRPRVAASYVIDIDTLRYAASPPLLSATIRCCCRAIFIRCRCRQRYAAITLLIFDTTIFADEIHAFHASAIFRHITLLRPPICYADAMATRCCCYGDMLFTLSDAMLMLARCCRRDYYAALLPPAAYDDDKLHSCLQHMLSPLLLRLHAMVSRCCFRRHAVITRRYRLLLRCLFISRADCRRHCADAAVDAPLPLITPPRR